MAIEAVKNTGVAYQGSSQKSVTEATSAWKDNSNVSRKQQELNIDGGNDAAENTLQLSTEALKKAVEEINKKVPNSEAIFGFHEETNRVTIKIVDKDSKKVIKEYPPEKTLDMIAKVWELAGILVDEKR